MALNIQLITTGNSNCYQYFNFVKLLWCFLSILLLKRFPAELHLVHVHEDFVLKDGSIDPIAFETPGGLAVLGIFLNVNNNTPKETAWFEVGVFVSPFYCILNFELLFYFQPIANAAREIVACKNFSVVVESVTINLNQISQRINPTFKDDFNYWYYDGSLTTPDCNEVVNWIIAEKPLLLSKNQVITNCSS